MVEGHRELFARLLEQLAITEGMPTPEDPDGGCSRADRTSDPTYAPYAELIARCGSNLAAVLRGETDAREVLLAPAAIELLGRLYTRPPTRSQFYNVLVADTVTALIAGSDPAKPLRVLEIGAGTGGTTSAVLPEAARRPDATTSSPTSRQAFLAHAREQFASLSMARDGGARHRARPGRAGIRGALLRRRRGRERHPRDRRPRHVARARPQAARARRRCSSCSRSRAAAIELDVDLRADRRLVALHRPRRATGSPDPRRRRVAGAVPPSAGFDRRRDDSHDTLPRASR